jgi:transcriptional regulator GlxA family with amidase domain
MATAQSTPTANRCLCQTWRQVAIIVLFAVLMKLLSRDSSIAEHQIWLLMTAAAAAVSLAGRHRRLVMLACTALALGITPSGSISGRPRDATAGTSFRRSQRRTTPCGVLVAYFVLAAWRSISRGAGATIRSGAARSCACMSSISACWGLAASHLLHGIRQSVLWAFLTVFTAYFWYLAYALLDQRRRKPEPFTFS